jgi:hypothetical protein
MGIRQVSNSATSRYRGWSECICFHCPWNFFSLFSDYADIWLTVPATWDKEGRTIMQEAAIAGGLIQKVRNSDHRWRDRLHIITENEAAAVYCSLHADIDRLMLSQNFMIVDAGGGSCTLAVRTFNWLHLLFSWRSYRFIRWLAFSTHDMRSTT